MDNNDRVLLVEGQDDKHVVLQLCKFHQPMPEFCILDKEDEAGKGGIEVLLRSRLKTPCRAVFRVVKRSRRRAFFIGRDALDPSGLESKQRSKP